LNFVIKQLDSQYVWLVGSRMSLAAITFAIIYMAKVINFEFASYIASGVTLGFALSAFDGGEILKLRQAIQLNKLCKINTKFILTSQISGLLIIYFIGRYFFKLNISNIEFYYLTITTLFISINVIIQQYTITIGNKKDIKNSIIYYFLTLTFLLLFFKFFKSYIFYFVFLNFITLLSIIYFLVFNRKFNINKFEIIFKINHDFYNSFALFISNLIFSLVPLLFSSENKADFGIIVSTSRMFSGYCSGFIQLLLIRSHYEGSFKYKIVKYLPVFSAFFSTAGPVIFIYFLNGNLLEDFWSKKYILIFVFIYSLMQSTGIILFIRCQYLIKNSYFMTYNTLFQCLIIYFSYISSSINALTFMILEIFFMLCSILYHIFLIRCNDENFI